MQDTDGVLDWASVRVLLVDAARDEREMYAEYLRQHGFCTLQAGTAGDGLRLASELAPQVVVSDVRLEGEDGIAFTRLLKTNAATRDVPVVLLTASGLERERGDAARAGCDAVLVKPSGPDQLLATVAALLRGAATERQTSRTEASLN